MESMGREQSLGRSRRCIRVRGTVQGVGFRPTVYRLARSLGLAGFVRNDCDGVLIEIEGDRSAIGIFGARLRIVAPPLSRVDAIEESEMRPRGDREFIVAESEGREAATTSLPADAATCNECLRELFDRQNRRYRYPFINCTDCGPRYTIALDVPYDRDRTTMSKFTLCAACRKEYEDPGDRRFHAEPNACADCGPRVELVGEGGARVSGDTAIAIAIEELGSGKIVAVKGLGGFQLAVDARNEVAVARLRARKLRPHKPFALMARDLAEVLTFARPSESEIRALRAPTAPIVLMERTENDHVSPSVAPGLREVGVMLPCTPLHHLLLAGAVPVLVMTSGNRSDEPIARSNDAALERLAGIDAFLMHDRDIHARADDSVVRVVAGATQTIRLARGLAPLHVALPFAAPPVLAVGAELKSAVCVTRGSEAVLSPHLGDVGNVETFEFFAEVIDKLSALLRVRPRCVAHDLHPDYRSTRWALDSMREATAVQHHHAHVASCMAEHGHVEPVIGIAFDGTGCGPDGDLWGGEVLRADLADFRRLGHLRPIALPGAEAAIREPWRLGVAALLDAGLPLDLFESRADEAARQSLRRPPLDTIRALLLRGVASPRATGAGRWFDAVSAICGICERATYEGQAAIELEARAAPGDLGDYPVDIAEWPGKPFEIDLRPTIRALADELRGGVSTGIVSARFHRTLASAIVRSCRRASERAGTRTVALSGGCFQNRLLSETAQRLLEEDGFEVLVHRMVPPNDGGLALGQAAVAAFRIHQHAERDRHPCA